MLALLLFAACDLGVPDRSTPGLSAPVVSATLAAGDAALATRYRLGAPLTVQRLTVWPVIDTRTGAGPDAVPLSKALTDGLAEVVEQEGGGSVPTLTLRNKGARPVLASAGDVVLGGKQDRILTETVLVAPGETLSVAVNCVEQGRWHPEGGDGFGFGGRGELDLRKTVRTEKDQQATWSKVAEVNAEKSAYVADAAKGDLAPSTGTYRASLKTADVEAKVQPLLGPVVAHLAADPQTVGFVVALGGTLEGIELYGAPGLFAAVRADAARSVVVEALGSQASGAPPSDAAASAFLTGTLTAPVASREAKGAGDATETSGAASRGYLVRDKQGELIQAMGYAK